MEYWCGKRTIITGASAGLGRAFAEVAVRHGMRIAIVARGQAALDDTAAQLRSLGGDVLTIAADVTKQPDVERMAATALGAWGGLDLFCHCAGRSMRGTALGTSPDEYSTLIDTNFVSAVRCVQSLANPLVESRGHVVLIGSLASKLAAGYLGAYPASKFPLAAFAQQLRLENEARGLHTLLVCPGPIARSDSDHSGGRYANDTSDVPASAHRPAGGAKVRAIDPTWLSEKILKACEKRRAELVVPWSARLLFATSQISPRVGDWLLRRMTSG